GAMQNRKLSAVLVCLAVSAVFMVSWPAVHSQRRPPTTPPPSASPTPEPPQRQVDFLKNSILLSSQKPRVLVNLDYSAISAIEPALTAAQLNDSLNKSMKKRRDFAWQIVKRIWTPVSVPGGDQIPIWMTWY